MSLPHLADPDVSRGHVLVVDDDVDLREGMAELIAEEGYVVETAANGQEALERLLDHREPRLMILDLMMPKVSGWQVLERLRDEGALAYTPTIITSAVADRAPDGVVAALKKPFDIERLLERVNEHCPKIGHA